MNEYIFNQCQNISDLVNQGEEDLARDEVIKLLDYMSKQGLSYNPLINALIREVGFTLTWKRKVLHGLTLLHATYLR